MSFCPCVVRSEPATLSLQEMQLLPPVKMPFARIRLENTVASQRSQKSQIWDLSLSQTKSFRWVTIRKPGVSDVLSSWTHSGKTCAASTPQRYALRLIFSLGARERHAQHAATLQRCARRLDSPLPGAANCCRQHLPRRASSRVFAPSSQAPPLRPSRAITTCLVCELECTAFADRKFTRSLRCVCTSLCTASVNTTLA